MSSLLSNLKTWLLLQKHGDLGYHYSSAEGLLRCHKIEKFRVANGTESNRLKHFLQISEIMEKGLGTFVLPQVVLISSIKPILSSYLFKYGFSRILERRFFFFNKSARLFQDWKLSMMQRSVQYNLTVTVMKF